MSKKRNLKDDITLIENLVQDQLNLIESRLGEMEQATDAEKALEKAKAALGELQESCTLTRALLATLKNNGNGQSVKARGGRAG